jgi:hypothetical protein
MSNAQNTSMPPYQQYQNFYPAGVNPYSIDPNHILSAMQNTQLTSNIYDGTNKTLFAVSDAQRQLTGELSGVTKDINDSTGKIVGTVESHALGLRDAIERGNSANAGAIERTAAATLSTVERVNSQLSTAVERNGSNILSATERVGGQVGSAVERNGGNILAAIEKVAGEGRLTTTVVDAASRQAANDSARDILAAVERNGGASVGASKDAYNGLLASIERNSGENRMTTITADSASQARLADTRRDIITNITGLQGEFLATVNKNHSDIMDGVTQSAWETRQNLSAQFSNLLAETQKNAAATALQGSQNYASLLLEGQKLAHHTDSKADAHFAAIVSKTDSQYASLLLEQQKVKECLAAQAANHFAVNQLEQQKLKEVITMQLQDAKYEALKNKQELSKEMAECCCEVKQKIDQRTQDVINTVDTLDRNRLRDEVNTITNENTILRLLDFDRGYGRRGRSRSPRRRSGSRERR